MNKEDNKSTDIDQTNNGNSASPSTDDDNNYLATGVSLGLCIGVALGAVFNNIGIGTAVGVCLGAFMGHIIQVRNN